MTGIETAIILIAFVVVAASFSFVVLNMGFFTAQRSKSVIGSGLGEASSALEIDGSVLGLKGNGTVTINNAEHEYIKELVIYVKLSSGRQPVELNPGKMVITFHNNRVKIDNVYTQNSSNVGCVITQVVGDDDSILEEGEKFKIEINLTAFNETQGEGVFLIPHDDFVIEIKPPVGAILTVERLVPPSIDQVTDLG